MVIALNGTAHAAAQPGAGPIVFVHGIKGARLADKQDAATAWVTGWQALGLSTPTLSLPLEWSAQGVQPRDSIEAAGPLERVTILPWLIEEQVYGPWLKAAQGLGAPFHAFAYDWRRDNLETLERLEADVRRISGQNGGKPVTLIGHSMGGLLSLALLHRHPELIARAVFVGVPFAGGIGFLLDLHAGYVTGLNHRILAPEVLFTFPSVYTLFPLAGDQPGDLVDGQGRPVAMDFYAASDWAANHLGVFALSPGPSVPDAARARGFLDQALPRARRFRELLALPKQLAKPARPYPPILVIAGDRRPTLVTAVHDGPKGVRGWDFESAPKEPGDGRVAIRDALPPRGIPYELYRTGAEHSQLLNDPGVIERIRQFIAARPRAIEP